MLQKALSITTLTSLTVVAASLLDSQGLLAAGDQPFTLENNSGQEITRIEMKRTGNQEKPWMQFQQLIPDGSLFNLVLMDAQCPANYMIRVQLTNGQQIVSPAVNLCEQRVFSLRSTGFDTSLMRQSLQSAGGPRQTTSPERLRSSSDVRFRTATLIPSPPPPPTLLPAMFDNYHPDRLLTSKALTSLNTMLSNKGFVPVSCSTAPVVMITVNNRYTACASPTAKYPGGQYKMTVPGL